MAVHDWRKVNAGVFHDFHNAWITELRNALNSGILPAEYYALSEQVAGQTGPDVLTLQGPAKDKVSQPDNGATGTLIKQPPKAKLIQQFEAGVYARKRKALVIRHSSDDRVIAMIEILSPGNKSSAVELRRFADKALGALNQDIHLLVVDLFPPGKRDPNGIHGAILAECALDTYQIPFDKPLTLAAYQVNSKVTSYVEPIAVGDALPDMPLFLDAESHVVVPLESTYERAYRGVPRRWREVLEGD